MSKLLPLLLLLLITACQTQENSQQPSTKSPTPQIKACQKDLKICPNGSKVARDPNNDCQFFPCSKAVTQQSSSKIECTQEVKQCPDGRFVGRDPNNNCQFPDCATDQVTH